MIRHNARNEPLTESQLVAAARARNPIGDTELCTDCGHAVDGHDRRAEDGICEVCHVIGGPCQDVYIKHEPGCPLEAGGDCDCVERRLHPSKP